MALFVVNTTKTACASAALKVAAQIASTTTKPAKIIGWDVSFDGTDSTKTPILCELVKTTSASATGGSAPTPLLVSAETSATSSCTARINDTADGGSPTVVAGYLVSPTGGLTIQFPLGREPAVKVSEFWEVRLTTVAGSGTPNYEVNLWFEE